MSRPLFRTKDTFASATDAVEFFNANRAETVGVIGPEVTAFLETLTDYDDMIRFNVQPGYRTHYVAAAVPGDRQPWLFAKPYGVVFQLGDERNVEAVLDMWHLEPGDLVPPALMLPTDVWFPPGELSTPGAEFCLRLAAAWAAPRKVAP